MMAEHMNFVFVIARPQAEAIQGNCSAASALDCRVAFGSSQ